MDWTSRPIAMIFKNLLVLIMVIKGMRVVVTIVVTLIVPVLLLIQRLGLLLLGLSECVRLVTACFLSCVVNVLVEALLKICFSVVLLRMHCGSVICRIREVGIMMNFPRSVTIRLGSRELVSTCTVLKVGALRVRSRAGRVSLCVCTWLARYRFSRDLG